ncbi:hypothetical protein D0Z07_1922 [Hyphodiscus hymeniophilus]|uniref:DM2 domain-containing protein n=1 Tax=Hyphodiscus hymeniophilus TaxID=353542 RepID=A0A9P6VPC0_9HELO|nr:hypothetical protein D0Z07_1922 [Hyphodiscus hymeniophilus]
MQAQQQQALMASDRAKLRSRKPTDKNIPEGVEDCIIGDGVQRYRELRDVERRLDATMMRKRLDVQDAVNRNVKASISNSSLRGHADCQQRYRTLRIWISNTVEDQSWQADTLDVDAFDFNTSMDSSYRVKIEGRLLNDEEEEIESDDSEDEDQTSGDAMDEDGKETEKQKKSKFPAKQYKLSHFFKAMTVEFDRKPGKDAADQNVEWKKPVVAPNATNLPNSADFDQLEFKRGGDENINITINLTRDETPERFQLSPALAEILDVGEATRAEAVMGIWDYIRANDLEEDEEKRQFECDANLRAIMTGPNKAHCTIPELPDHIKYHMTSLAPIKLPYTIRVDQDFHENPQPTIYDVRVLVDDPLRAALASYLSNPSYPQSLLEITNLNDHLALLVQKIANSKSKHTFFDSLSKNPTEFIAKWLSSQKRDLEVISGEATRGGGEDASGDEWRRGGKDGIWGSENVRESVNLIVGSKSRV